jgi:hypothetical protein
MAARFKQQPDPRGGHIRLYWSLFDSVAWRALTHADIRVYLAMRRRLGKTNNGDISATLALMKHAGINSSSTLAAALSRLQALGFIEQTRRGGIASGGKMCSLYRFTDEPTLDIGKIGQKGRAATNEWQQFSSISHARAALRPPAKNTSKDRPSSRSDSNIESETPASDSTIEHEACSPVRASRRESVDPNGPGTRMNSGIRVDSAGSNAKGPSASTIEHLCSIAIPARHAAGEQGASV